MKTEDVLWERFREPAACFRSFPFWSWNDHMDPEEIRRQIRGMKKAGIGGFFLHSRDGLETPYLGEEWMNCVRAAVEAASDCGMYAWLYDEDRWPSGTAGGQVTALGEEYCCKGLTLEICAPEALDDLLREGALTALYAARFHEMELEDFRRLSITRRSGLYPGERLLAVRLEVSAKSQWFNDQAPPDQLNPVCVRKFLELTHEKYKAVVGDAFGGTVPGIFSDEPSLADTHAFFGTNRGWIPWTCDFGEYFQEKRGYDFLDVLPYQYFHGKHSSRTRHDYWHTIAERFSETYTGTIAAWCKETGIACTGHFLQEDKLGLCTRVNGAVMPHYALQDIPGIDILTERTTEYLTVKQCTSVAHQFGKKRVLTETYGCTGWDFTLEGQKWVGDWQYVLGVNLRTTHTALYSLRGCRKRDYPPSFNYNNTWWEKNHLVEDYFARLGAVLSAGEPVRRLLILHPASTAWSRVGTNPYGNPVRRQERDVPEVDEYGYRLNELLETLCREHMDCDLGDEMLLQKHGIVKEGRLGLGEVFYDVAVLPRLDTLFASTCALLLSFLEQGGRIGVLEPAPFMIEGDPRRAQSLEVLLKHPGCYHAATEGELLRWLDVQGVRPVRLLEKNGGETLEETSAFPRFLPVREQTKLLALTVKCGKDTVLFTVNNDRSKACEAWVLLPGEGQVEEWDPLTGKSCEILSAEKEAAKPLYGAGICFPARWEKAGSHLYVIRGSESCAGTMEDLEERLRGSFAGPRERFGERPLETPAETDGQQSVRFLSLPPEVPVRLNAPNVLTLDICRYRIEDGKWSAPMEVWMVQEQTRKQLEMPMTGKQRYLWIRQPQPKDGTRVELCFTFRTECELLGCLLALESPEDFRILCNGRQIDSKLDRAFETVKLPTLSAGQNEIFLQCDYRNRTELENCYLLGDFGVTEKRRLCPKPLRLKTGDWTAQGLFHYCGSVTYLYSYCWDGQCQVKLCLGEYRGGCLTVTAGERIWELPWSTGKELNLSETLQKGDNLIQIQVLGSPRNMLGPLHYKEKYPVNTRAECFQPKEKDRVEAYQVVPYGLLETPVIEERRWREIK